MTSNQPGDPARRRQWQSADVLGLRVATYRRTQRLAEEVPLCDPRQPIRRWPVEAKAPLTIRSEDPGPCRGGAAAIISTFALAARQQQALREPIGSSPRQGSALAGYWRLTTSCAGRSSRGSMPTDSGPPSDRRSSCSRRTATGSPAAPAGEPKPRPAPIPRDATQVLAYGSRRAGASGAAAPV
jgi:hypothetical protein